MERATIYKLMLGTAAVSGAAMLGTVSGVGPAAALLPLLGGIASKTADSIGLQFFSSTAERLAERLAGARGRGAELFRNEHLQALFTDTLAEKLLALAEDESLDESIRRRLPALSAKARVCWQAWAQQSPEQSPARHLLDDEGITSFFSMSQEQFQQTRALDAEVWGGFLLHLEQSISRDSFGRKVFERFTQDIRTAFNRQPLDQTASRKVGAILADTLPASLFNAAKDSFESNKPAYAGLQLHLMRELMTDVREVLADGSRTRAAVGDMRDELASLADSLRERSVVVESRLDASLREQFGHFHEEIVRRHEQTIELLSSVAAVLVPKLSEVLERGWEGGDRYRFPFEYLKPSTSVFGAEARRLVEEEFSAFLNDPRPVCWWMWTGLEGAGKSRLAMEACRARGGWQAGFVSHDRRCRLGDRWRAMVADGDTILVLDDISTDPAQVRTALAELIEHFTFRSAALSGHRVRILLLERHVEPLAPGATAPHWFTELFPVGADGLDVRSRLLIQAQYPEERAASRHIDAMQPTDAGELAMAYARQLPALASEEAREAVVTRALDLVGANPRPLHVLLTVHVLSEKSAPGAADPEDFRGVVTTWLNGRIAQRREKLAAARADELTTRQVLNLVCLATVLGEIRLEDVPAHPELPDETTRARSALLEAVGQQPGSGVIRGLEPHLIGEWFVFLWAGSGRLGESMSSSHLSEILAKLPDSTRTIEAFVQRSYRIFHEDHLWRILRNRLGRYATPFGRLFDVSARQAALLGGTTEAAIRQYHDAVRQRVRMSIEETGYAVVVDLMAGGSDLPRSLIAEFTDEVTVIAIDRDLSRIAGSPGSQLEFERAEIDGTLPLGEIVARHNRGTPQCDLVIAKKALHEMTWESQRQLIQSLGQVVRPGGALVVYADSPHRIDRKRARIGERLDARLKAELKLDASESDLAAARNWLMAPGITFEADDPCDAALFANLWIKLKDWANYNWHEWSNRYFSSRNELEDELRKAGFAVSPVDGADVTEFAMSLHGPRFQEEAINRLSYLCQDSDVEQEELSAILSENPRYRFFWDFSRGHLWHGQAPTPFGRSKHVRAKMEEPFRLSSVTQDGTDVTGSAAHVPELHEPSFEMPVHIFSLRKLP